MWGGMTREIRKRLDMRMVSGFVVAFVPNKNANFLHDHSTQPLLEVFCLVEI